MGQLRFITILDSQIARLECAGKSNGHRLHRHRPDHINPRGGAYAAVADSVSLARMILKRVIEG